MPYYDFQEFKKDCDVNPKKVLVFGEAEEDAGRFFNLENKTQIREFIANDGLEHLCFLNFKPWEHNPDKNNPIMVDGYEFRSLGKLGYIAFMRNRVGNWVIKSFHLSQNSNLTMLSALKKAGIIEEKKK